MTDENIELVPVLINDNKNIIKRGYLFKDNELPGHVYRKTPREMWIESNLKKLESRKMKNIDSLMEFSQK